MYTLYFALNRLNGKAYGGITKHSVQKRFAEHCSKAHQGSKFPFHAAIHKYGPEAFDLITVWRGDKAGAVEREISLIKEMRLQHSRFGYNATDGGQCIVMTPEMRQKISVKAMGNKRALGHKQTPEVRKQIRLRMRGNKHSLSRIVSNETRRKMSQTKMGHEVSEEARRKMSEAKKGRLASVETRQKMSESQRKRWALRKAA